METITIPGKDPVMSHPTGRLTATLIKGCLMCPTGTGGASVGSRLWWWKELLVGLFRPAGGKPAGDRDWPDLAATTPESAMVSVPAGLPTVCVDNLVIVFPAAQETAAVDEAARLRGEGRHVIEARMTATELAMLTVEDPSVTVDYRR